MGSYYWPYCYEGHNYLPPQQPHFQPVTSIPAIVNQILSYSSIADLKLKRLVCKQWNYEALKIIRPKIQIQLNEYRRVLSYFLTMNHHRSFSDSFCFGQTIQMHAPVINQFLMNFGQYIRSIEIRSNQIKLSALRFILYCLLPNLEELTINANALIIDEGVLQNPYDDGNQFHQISVQHLPRLKKLCLIDNQCRETNINMASFTNNKTTQLPSYVLLKELLMAALNIQEIACVKNVYDFVIVPNEEGNTFYQNFHKNHPRNDLQFQSANLYLWSTLVDINNWEILFPNLRKIDVKVKVSDDCIQKLATKGFPLATLDLNLQSNVTNKSLQFLLSSLKDTLINLKLKWQYSAKPEIKSELQIFEPFYWLKTIDLTNYHGSLQFVDYCPYLLKLTLSRISLNNVVLKDLGYPYNTHVHWSLQILKVYEDYSKIDIKNDKRSVQAIAIQRLGQLFPSIRSLRLEKLTDESLGLIYAQWPNIEELEIVEGKFTDSGTCGIHPNAYKVILREEAYDIFNVNALRQGLFIGNLAKLQKLYIHSSKVTDVTIMLGVLQCSNIRTFAIQSYWITDTAICRLSINRNIINLKTENCNQLTPAAISFATKKLRERGGTASLNKYNGPMKQIQIKKFLRISPNAQVCLNRLKSVVKHKPIIEKEIIQEINELKVNKKYSTKVSTTNCKKLNLRSKFARRPRNCRSIFRRPV